MDHPDHLPLRTRAALACYLLLALGFALQGTVYLVRAEFLPYHAEVLGQGWAELSARLRLLLLAFQRGAGAASLSGALGFALLAWFPFRRGEAWARWAVPLVGLVAVGPLVAVVAWLKASTGAAVPLVPAVAALALLFSGAALGARR